jgi:hypothetical protein
MDEAQDLKTTDWKNTDKRFVAFFDILGFRDLVMRSTHSEIYKLLTLLSKYRATLNGVENFEGLPESYKNAGIYNVSFSDSIVIFSKGDSLENFEIFTLMTGWFFANAIAMKIPIKGALATGEISLNKSNQIYFGQPIIDAYLLEEELNYMGIVAHNSIDNYIEKIPDDNYFKNGYKEILTPLKCGNISHLNYNWFRDFENVMGVDNKNEFLKSKIKEFNKQISGSPRRYIDNTIKVIDEIYPLHKIQ